MTKSKTKKNRETLVEKEVKIEEDKCPCFAKGCTNEGRYESWCCKECWGTPYCSQECFERELEIGMHQRICRKVMGLENIELKLSDYLKPDKIYRTTKIYRHKGFYAKKKIYRGKIFLNEIPLVVDSDMVYDDMAKDLPDILKKQIMISRHHPDAVLNDEDPYRWAILRTYKETDSDKTDKIDSTSCDRIATWVQNILLNREPERVRKFISSRYRHRKGQYVNQWSELINEMDETNNEMSTALLLACVDNFDMFRKEPVGAMNGNCGQVWINHSCNPNICINIICDNIYYTAMRDIEPGEEITISYIRVEEMIQKKYRREKIYNMMGFTCVCKACQEGFLPTGGLGGLYDVCPDVIPYNDGNQKSLKAIAAKLHAMIHGGKMVLLTSYENEQGERIECGEEYYKSYLMLEQFQPSTGILYDNIDYALGMDYELQDMLEETETKILKVRKLREALRDSDKHHLIRKIYDGLDAMIHAFMTNKEDVSCKVIDHRIRFTTLYFMEQIIMIGNAYNEARPAKNMMASCINAKQNLRTMPFDSIFLHIMRLRYAADADPNRDPKHFSTKYLDELKRLKNELVECLPYGYKVSQWFARGSTMNGFYGYLWRVYRILETQ